jgi:phosphoglycerate dehydrogenase-like enzyme
VFYLNVRRAADSGKQHRCNGDQVPVIEESKSYMLCDSTLGIVGLGHIGGEVVKLAKAFNMRVIAFARNPGGARLKSFGFDFIGLPDNPSKIPKESDFVLLAVPLRKKACNLIGEKQLKMIQIISLSYVQ